MTEEEQIKIIREIQSRSDNWYNFKYIVKSDNVGNEIESDEDYIYSFVETGGSEGASCWDVSPSVGYSIDYVPGIKHLEEILEKIAPNISFLKFRKIENSLQKDEYFDSDYYGNGTNYKIYFISIERFLEIVNE